MKYRKRPILVEAEQWWPPGDHRHRPIEGVEFHLDFWWCDTDRLCPGDWVVQEVVRRYVVRERDFAERFEAVEE